MDSRWRGDWDAYVTAAKQKPLYGLALDETVADFWLNSAREMLVETEIVSEKLLLICQSAVMVPVNVFASDRYQKSLADRFPKCRASLGSEGRRAEVAAAGFYCWRQEIERFDSTGKVDYVDVANPVERKLVF